MINYGLATKQHPGYGISHDNIAKKLTEKNWTDKAIVRDGNYLFVIECSYHGDRMYFIHGLPSEKSKNEYHEYLEDAIFTSAVMEHTLLTSDNTSLKQTDQLLLEHDDNDDVHHSRGSFGGI